MTPDDTPLCAPEPPAITPVPVRHRLLIDLPPEMTGPEIAYLVGHGELTIQAVLGGTLIGGGPHKVTLLDVQGDVFTDASFRCDTHRVPDPELNMDVSTFWVVPRGRPVAEHIGTITRHGEGAWGAAVRLDADGYLVNLRSLSPSKRAAARCVEAASLAVGTLP
jgi:hypothetical protein